MADKYLDVLSTYSRFIATYDYRVCLPFATSDTEHVLVVYGQCGSGKTLLCKQLCIDRIYTNHGGQTILYKLFNCQDLDKFYIDLDQFYTENNIPKGSLEDQQPRDWQRLINALYQDVNTHSELSQHHKLFIFDYAEKLPDVLKALNNLCLLLRNHSSNVKPDLWRFLVNSQKTPNPGIYQYIGEESFRHFTGFTERQAVQLFQKAQINESMAKKMFAQVGSSPLVLVLCVEFMERQTLEYDEFFEEFMTMMQEEARRLQQAGQVIAEESKNALITIKLSFNYLVSDLKFPAEVAEEFIKLITFFPKNYLFKELLISAAETIVQHPKEAQVLAQNLISQMVERELCSISKDSDGQVVRVNQLVMKAMKLYIGPGENINLLQKAQVALLRVIPIDGRKHWNHTVAFYVEHAKKLDEEIEESEQEINCEETPLIMLLHCNILASMVYCIVSQKVDSESGPERLKQALDTYCRLFMRTAYQTELDQARGMNEIEADASIAERLYDRVQEHPITRSPKFLEYVTKLPQYHRLTKKDLEMMNYPNVQLVNDHVTKGQLEKFRQGRRVVDPVVLARIFPAEILALIYRVGSNDGITSVHDAETRRQNSIRYGEAAMAVYNKIFNSHHKLLMASVITEREVLDAKLKTPISTVEDVQRIQNQIVALEGLKDVSAKVYAFEAGIMKSDMSKDHYHLMVCAQSKIICLGHQYVLSLNDNQFYYQGERLLQDVKRHAKKQYFPESALSHCYKRYGVFLALCQKYKEAIKYIVSAMNQLGQHIARNETWCQGGQRSYREFESYRFPELYDDLRKYYDEYQLTARAGDVILAPSTEEYGYLRAAGANMSGVHGQNADGETLYPILLELVPQDAAE